jgi:hypothetical protein
MQLLIGTDGRRRSLLFRRCDKWGRGPPARLGTRFPSRASIPRNKAAYLYAGIETCFRSHRPNRPESLFAAPAPLLSPPAFLPDHVERPPRVLAKGESSGRPRRCSKEIRVA